MRQLSEQLESQANLHQAAIRRAREAEGCFDDYKDRVRTLEGGLASSDALRDNLRTERQKVSFFDCCFRWTLGGLASSSLQAQDH